MTTSPIPTRVIADDPVTHEGISANLRDSVDVDLLTSAEGWTAVVGADRVTDEAVRHIRLALDSGARGVLLVLAHLDEEGMLAAVDAGAHGLILRNDATPERLAAAVRSAASGDCGIPAGMLGNLLRRIGTMGSGQIALAAPHQRRLGPRERAVLQLVADGHGTGRIAGQLSMSERTVKNVIHGVALRLGVRNRSQAVALALREGLL